MTEEEKKAIEILETEGTENHYLEVQIVLHVIEKQQKEIEELIERLSIRKEQQETILTEKIKTLREEKIELIHNFEEGEKIFKKEIKSLLKEIEELKERQDYARLEKEQLLEDSISKDKISELIKEIEKQQEDNRKELYNAIQTLNFRKIDEISNRISKNIIERDILKQLLEE